MISSRAVACCLRGERDFVRLVLFLVVRAVALVGGDTWIGRGSCRVVGVLPRYT